MNRREFLEKLEYLLQDIPEEEKVDALAYYKDYFEEAGDDGEQQAIQAFGSPERVAAMIRSNLDGSLESGGEFTDSGYQDVRFREPGYHVVQAAELESESKERTQTYEERVPRSSHAKADRPQSRSLVWSIFKIGALLLAIGLLSPLILGAGSIAVGVVAGVASLAVAAILGIGILTVAACVGAVMTLIFGVGLLPAHMMTGVMVLGAGVVILGLALIGVACSILVYGYALPWCFRGIVNFVSGFLHRRKGRYV